MRNLIIENYINKLVNNDMNSILSKYSNVIKYSKQEDLTKGLLRYKQSQLDTAFLFILPEENFLTFHTIGMNFPIDIYFFNSKKELVNRYENVKPNIKRILSKYKSKYVIEICR